MVYKFFDTETSGGAINNEVMSNKELVEELHKPIVKKILKKSILTFYRQYFGC